MVKEKGEEKTVEGLWTILGAMQPKYGISFGTMAPGDATGPMTTTWPGGWVVQWSQEQTGVIRFNCADSLDRTNVASYFAATESLVEQAKVCGLRIIEAQRLSKPQMQQPVEETLSVISFTKVSTRRRAPGFL